MTRESRTADLGPGKRCTLVAAVVDDVRRETSVEIGFVLDLDDDHAVAVDELGRSPEESGGITANADIAVEQERHAPRTLSGNAIENAALDDRQSGLARESDSGFGHVEAESGEAEVSCRPNHPTRTAPDVENGARRAGQQTEVDIVGVGHPSPQVVFGDDRGGAATVTDESEATFASKGRSIGL